MSNFNYLNRKQRVLPKFFQKIAFILVLLLGLFSNITYAQLNVSLSVQEPSCNGYSDAVITAEMEGGEAPFTYAWSNGMTTHELYGIGAGDYGLTVTDAIGEAATATIIVTEPDALEPVIEFTSDICEGTNGSIAVMANGGTPPYTYAWSNGMDTDNVDDLSEGLIAVTVTDANGCIGTAIKIINKPLSTEVRTIDVLCADFCDGSAEAMLEGGTAPFSFQWSNGATSQIIDLLEPGEYGVTVIDANGCTVEGVGTVAEPPSLFLEVNVEGTCEEEDNITAKASAAGGIPPYTFSWSNGDVGETTDNISRGTTYFVTVTDANGCNIDEIVAIPLNPGLVIFTEVDNAACNSGEGGSATALANGGQPPYTYVWSDAQTGEMATELAAGTYSVTATDANGCQGESSIEVASGDELLLFTSTVNATCTGMNDGMANVLAEGGEAPYSILWSNGQFTNTAMNLEPGTYSVTITDSQECMGETTVEVGANTTIQLSFEASNTTCPEVEDGSINLSASGGLFPYSYQWDHGPEEPNLTDLTTGTYNVVVTDANNCSATESITIGSETSLMANFDYEITNCDENNTLTVAFNDATPEANSWQWTIDGDQIFDIPNPVIQIEEGSDVSVELSVTATNGCSANIDENIEIKLFDLEVPTAAVPCVGEEANLSIINNTADDLMYSWTPEDIFIDGTDTPTPTLNTEMPLETTATVLITHPLGCTTTETLDIKVQDEIVPDPATVMTEQCEGTEVDFIHTMNGVDYMWDFGDPNNPNATSEEQEATYMYSEPGTYMVSLSPVDETACAGSLTFDLEVAEAPEVDFAADFENCTNGLVTFTNQSSIPDSLINSLEWTFSNGEMSTEPNPTTTLDESGTVMATLTIAFGENCELSAEQEIDVDVMPSIEIPDKFSCSEDAVELNPNPNETYTYNWSPADNFDPNAPNPQVMLTTPTTFMVTVTDASGNCETVEEVAVNIAEPIEFEAPNDVEQCDNSMVSLETDSEQAVSIEWYSDPALTNLVGTGTTLEYTPDERETTFYINYVDANDCAVTDQVSVFNYEPSVELANTPPLCVDASTNLEAINLIEEDELSFNWIPAENLDDAMSATPTATPTETTTYTVMATNQFGCFVEGTTTVEVVNLENELNVNAEPDTILNNGLEASQLTATEDGGYTYTWNNTSSLNQDGIFNPVATPTETTVYTLTIEDENGCTAEENIEVVVRQSNCVEPFIFIPNAFTPNGDGENDVLFVRGYSITGLRLLIYNRWGEKVFETRDITRGWDGTYKGKAPCSDVYGYYLEVDCFGGERFTKKGNVTILK